MGFFDTLFGSSSKSTQTAAGTIAEQQASNKDENQTTSGSQSQSSTGSTTGTTSQAASSSQSGQQSTTGSNTQSTTGSSTTQTGGTVNASSASSLLNALSGTTSSNVATGGTTSSTGTTTTSSLDAGTLAKLSQLIDTLGNGVNGGTSPDVTGLRGIAANELNFANDDSGLAALIKSQTDEATQQYNLTTGAAENVTAQTIGSEGNSYVGLMKGQDAAMLAKEIANIVGQTTLAFRGQQQSAYGTAANALSGAASADIAAKNAPIQQLLAAVDAMKGATVTSTEAGGTTTAQTQAGTTTEAQKSEQSQTGSSAQQSTSSSTTEEAQFIKALQNALTASSQTGTSNVTGSSTSNTQQDTVATFLQQLQDAINSSSSANQQTSAIQTNKGKSSTPLINFL